MTPLPASTFIGLLVAIFLATKAVMRIWKPDPVWLAFIDAQLKRNGIAFKAY